MESRFTFSVSSINLCLHLSVSRYFVEDGILQIINVSHRDQGVYTCVARTPVDRDTASALLMVLGELTCEHSFHSGPEHRRPPVLP